MCRLHLFSCNYSIRKLIDTETHKCFEQDLSIKRQRVSDMTPLCVLVCVVACHLQTTEQNTPNFWNWGLMSPVIFKQSISNKKLEWNLGMRTETYLWAETASCCLAGN